MNLMNYLLACGMVMDDNGEWDVSTYLHIIIIGWITAKKKILLGNEKNSFWLLFTFFLATVFVETFFLVTIPILFDYIPTILSLRPRSRTGCIPVYRERV